MLKNKIKAGFSLLLIVAFASCSTTTRITSTPENANVYINNQFIGKTPVMTELSNFVGNDYTLAIEGPDGRRFARPLDKEIKAGPLLCGLIGLGVLVTLPGFLWCYGPKQYYHMDLGVIKASGSDIYATTTSGGVWKKTKNLKVAVLDFDSKVKDAEGETFSEIFTIGMVSTDRFVVVDRNQLDKILKEQKLQLTGLTESEKAVKIGKLAGANKIVTGRISKVGGKFYITVKGINVETGIVETGASAEDNSVEGLVNLTKQLADSM